MFDKTERSIFDNAGLIYSATQNQLRFEYTDIATGDLDFERLVNEDIKCWRLPIAAHEPIRKKIIITDLSTRFKIYTSHITNNYDDRHTYEFELWNALLDHGFEIYAWTGQLIPIKNNADLLEHLILIEPIKTSVLIEKLSPLGMNKDECFFATTSNCRRLLSDVFINQVAPGGSYKSLPNSLLVLMSLPYDMLEAYLDMIDREESFTIECNLSTILNYDCGTFLKKIAYLNPEIYLQGLKPGQSVLYKKFVSTANSFPSDLAQCIKAFVLEKTDFNEREILDFFMKFKNITSLEIFDVNVTNSSVGNSDTTIAFSSLKTLTFTDMIVSDFFFYMLNNSPDLNDLILYSCDLSNLEFSLKNNALKSVKKLRCEFNSSLFNDFPLIHLLNKTECLEKLQIEKISIPCDLLTTIEDSKLVHLKELEITQTIGIIDSNFINLCLNLESLTIRTMCSNSEQIVFEILNKINLPRLNKVLFINNGKIIPVERFSSATDILTGSIKHDWCKFKIDDFISRVEEFSNLQAEADKTNNLRLLYQVPVDYQSESYKTPTVTFDGNTGLSNKPLKAIEYFCPKGENGHVHEYRLETFTFGGIGEQVCFIPTPEDNYISLEILQADDVRTYYDEHYQEKPFIFLGTIELFPKNQDTWIKLPSFTADDTILMVSKMPGGSVEIRRHNNDFHYARINAVTNNPGEFHFVVKAPEWRFQNCRPPIPSIKPTCMKDCTEVLKHIFFDNHGTFFLPTAFHKGFHFIKSLPCEYKAYVLFAFCESFTVEELTPAKETMETSSWEFLNNVIREQKGCCRHRAKVFVVFASLFDMEAELVQNDCHAVAQVKLGDNTRQIYDFGGAEVQLEIEHISKKISARHQKMALKNQTINPDNPYICWQWQQSHAQTFEAYNTELLMTAEGFHDGKKNILIAMEDAQIEAFLANMQMLQQERKRHYIYIDNLDNIKTTQTVLENNGEKSKRDSRLLSSIKYAQPGDVLVVNCFEMKAEHIVYNTMMDIQKRTLKGMDLPPGLILISLQPHTRSISEDFDSRFQLRSKCPANVTSQLFFPPINRTLTDEQKKLACINIYFPDEYKQLMTCRLACRDADITVIESLLITAIKNGDSGIIIRNAPWNDVTFRIFLGEMLYSKQFEANGRIINIPAEFKFILWDKPYEPCKDYLEEDACESEDEHADLKILNHLTFKSFFNKFSCQNGQFKTLPGWIEQYRGQTLNVIASPELSENHWVLLLEEARLYATKIKISTIAFHQTDEQMLIENTCNILDELQLTSSIMQASDLDLAESLYFNDTSRFTVIHVSESTAYNDIIERYERDHLSGWYTHRLCYAAQALLDNKIIILKGELSTLLKKQLASLLLPKPYFLNNGQFCELNSGQFKLLTTKTITGDFYPCQSIPLPEPWVVLSRQFSPTLLEQVKTLAEAFAEYLPQEPLFDYIQLQSLAKGLIHKPFANPLKSLLRLKANYQEIKPILEKLWETVDPVKKYLNYVPDDITIHRIQKVCSELKHSPYVFVAGSSGSGKSTLFFYHWEKHIPGAKIFVGLEQIKAWIQSSVLHPYLVIDEANLLSKNAFVFLESLMQNPSYALVDGCIMPVSPRHKIIFIGNFGYFKDRIQQDFFNRHGHIITFKELPDSILKSGVLLPILCTQTGSQPLDKQADILLKSWRWIKQSLKDAVSVRNLEMFTWRFLVNLYSSQNETDALCLALYDEFQIFFTTSDRPDFARNINAYKAMKNHQKNAIVFDENDFILTPTRRNPLRLIQQFLHIREQKLSTSSYFTGIQGLILEGDSAEGKSSLLIHYLNSNTFVLANEHNRDNPKRYYLIEDFESLEPILSKAFHEGALVIINEMNTMPVEWLLNHYMSGMDMECNAAKNTGFAVFATQNPISFDFRKPLSAALRNRFQMIHLKEYKPKEIQMIAQSLCNETEFAEIEANQYLEARQYAKNKGLLKPNIRTFINICDKKRKADDDLHKNDDNKRFCPNR